MQRYSTPAKLTRTVALMLAAVLFASFCQLCQRNAGLYEADMPVQLVLANALANFYPC